MVPLMKKIQYIDGADEAATLPMWVSHGVVDAKLSVQEERLLREGTVAQAAMRSAFARIWEAPSNFHQAVVFMITSNKSTSRGAQVSLPCSGSLGVGAIVLGRSYRNHDLNHRKLSPRQNY